MLIQCTKSLLDKIGVKGSELVSPEGYDEFPDSMMAWHAHFVSMNKRKAIILMNNETRYPVVIYRPTTKDFSNIKDTIHEAIQVALQMEGIKQEVIDAYFDKAGEIAFSKTANRSMISKLNNTVRDVEFNQEYLNEKTKIQRYISIVAGRLIQLSGKDDGFFPYEKMLDCLGHLFASNDTIIDATVYQLKINIDLNGHDIWRRVLVPSIYSFRHLHNLIQTVFDWQDYHLHEFEVEREKHRNIKIMMDDSHETLEYVNDEDFEMIQERFVALEDIFPKYKKVRYVYDFGDSWTHTITLENVLNSHEGKAIYLEGFGERPPEDVGGEGGFEEYLKVIGDPAHSEYGHMLKWAESQRERRRHPEQINKQLKSILKGYRYSIYSL